MPWMRSSGIFYENCVNSGGPACYLLDELVQEVIMDDVEECAYGDEEACANFEEYLNALYPECYGGVDVACDIIDDTIREYWEILQDWCDQGYRGL